MQPPYNAASPAAVPRAGNSPPPRWQPSQGTRWFEVSSKIVRMAVFCPAVVLCLFTGMQAGLLCHGYNNVMNALKSAEFEEDKYSRLIDLFKEF